MRGGFLIAILCIGALVAPSFSAERDYTDFVKNLQEKIKLPAFKGASYERLAYITDSYGARMWGSSTLEQVIS